MGWKDVVYFILLVLEYIIWNWIILEHVTSEIKSKRLQKVVLSILVLLAGMYAYNGISCRISTAIVLFFPIFMAVLFIRIFKRNILVVCFWEFLVNGGISLVKLFYLVIVGLYKNINIGEVNRLTIRFTDIVIECAIVLGVLVVYIKVKAYHCRIFELINQNKVIFLLIGLFEYEMMSFVMGKGHQEMEIHMLFWICGTVIIVSVIIALLVMKMLFAQIRLEKQLMVQKQKNVEMYYAQMKQNYEKIARINHDINHERIYLYQCIKDGQLINAINYLERIMQSVTKQKIWTGNKTVDFLIDIKREEMNEKRIEFRLLCEYIDVVMSDEDLCFLLGLLLENAVEAAEKCDEGKRWVRLELMNINDVFQLKVKNACVGKPVKRNGRFVSDKESDGTHGWGLLNVERIVNKYNGSIRYMCTEETFDVQVVFWENNKEEKENARQRIGN